MHDGSDVGDAKRVGVFVEASFLNHSCAPNAYMDHASGGGAHKTGADKAGGDKAFEGETLQVKAYREIEEVIFSKN